MDVTDNDAILIRRYLLSKVTGQEREQVEQRLMTDRQYLDRFIKAEESLMDEYVKGELGGDEIEPFETHFLSAPERRDRLEFAKSFNKYMAEAKTWKSAEVVAAGGEAAGSRAAISRVGQSTSRAVLALLAVAMLILIAGTIILLTENARLREQLLERRENSSQAEDGLRQQLGEQVERNEELARQLEQARSEMSKSGQESAALKQEKSRRREGTASGVASLIITSGSVRGKGQTNSVYLTNDIQWLRLELKVQGEEHESYRAEVRPVEGRSMWRGRNLTARQRGGEKTVAATLPARRLPEGDYLVALSAAAPGGGYEEVATYHFTILRE